MARRSRYSALGWLVVIGLLGAGLVAPAVFATQPDPAHKVTICHRTNSNTNPYVMNTVDIASAGHYRGGHDSQHLGPIWDATLKARHIEWGDIIPPYTYGSFSYPGLNWTAQGRAIWDNECTIPEPSPSLSPPADASEPASPRGSVEAESGSPYGSVEAESGSPDGRAEAAMAVQATPPATDGMTASAAPSTDGWRLILVALAGLLSGALLVTAEPRTIRR